MFKSNDKIQVATVWYMLLVCNGPAII